MVQQLFGLVGKQSWFVVGEIIKSTQNGFGARAAQGSHNQGGGFGGQGQIVGSNKPATQRVLQRVQIMAVGFT